MPRRDYEKKDKDEEKERYKQRVYLREARERKEGELAEQRAYAKAYHKKKKKEEEEVLDRRRKSQQRRRKEEAREESKKQRIKKWKPFLSIFRRKPKEIAEKVVTRLIVKKQELSASQIKMYIEQAYQRGYTKGQVKAKLLDRGWPKKIVDEYCDYLWENYKKS